MSVLREGMLGIHEGVNGRITNVEMNEWVKE